MQKILYALQFNGSAAPREGAEGTLDITATASAGGIRTTIGPQGVTSTVEQAAGEATFESVVTMMGTDAFNEQGTIRFGPSHSLRFSTVGRGTVGESPQPGVSRGAVIWQIDGGEGQFTGAKGLITSNFYFDAEGNVTDNQIGVIFID